MAESSVLLGDFDLRRPIVHSLFQIDRAPGLSDFLTGQCTFAQALRRVESMNLYLLPAGSPVKNPLELLNMRQSRMLFEELPRHREQRGPHDPTGAGRRGLRRSQPQGVLCSLQHRQKEPRTRCPGQTQRVIQ